MTQREQFMKWWKGDEERAKCFLEQAVVAYLSTFPARSTTLLCELLDEPVSQTALCPKCNRWGVITDDGIYCPFCEPSSTTDHDQSVPGIAEQGDHTERPVEGGVYSKVLAAIEDNLDSIAVSLEDLARRH